MVYTRYRFAADFCRRRRVLEVACGPGVGLGYLARHAGEIVGGDLTGSLLGQARRSLRGVIPLVILMILPGKKTSKSENIVCFISSV